MSNEPQTALEATLELARVAGRIRADLDDLLEAAEALWEAESPDDYLEGDENSYGHWAWKHAVAWRAFHAAIKQVRDA